MVAFFIVESLEWLSRKIAGNASRFVLIIGQIYDNPFFSSEKRGWRGEGTDVLVKKVCESLTKFGVRWWLGVARFLFLGVGRLLDKRQNSLWVSGKAPFRGLGVTPLGKRVRPLLGKRVRPL